jgi:hypothetical protein
MYNTEIFESLLSDTEIHLSGKFFTLPEVASLIKSLYALDTITPELMELLLNYIVD